MRVMNYYLSPEGFLFRAGRFSSRRPDWPLPTPTCYNMEEKISGEACAMAKVTTGTGDDGYTGLLGDARVPKYDPRPDTFGTVDEATSALGMARALTADGEIRDLILHMQRDLYVLMAELATP